MRKIADHLELRFDDLEKKKGKIGDKVKAWVKKEPEVAVLMRKISSMPNGVEKLRQIIDDAEKKRSK